MKNNKITIFNLKQMKKIAEFNNIIKPLRFKFDNNNLSKLFTYIDENGKLDKEFKSKWITALSDGSHKQGNFGALRYVDVKYDGTKEVQHCCLGVACHISGASGLIGKSFIKNDADGKIKSINKVPKLLHGINILTEILAHINDKSTDYSYVVKIIKKYL